MNGLIKKHFDEVELMKTKMEEERNYNDILRHRVKEGEIQIHQLREDLGLKQEKVESLEERVMLLERENEALGAKVQHLEGSLVTSPCTSATSQSSPVVMPQRRSSRRKGEREQCQLSKKRSRNEKCGTVPDCGCTGGAVPVPYNHLGRGGSIAEVRRDFARRMRFQPSDVRVEVVVQIDPRLHRTAKAVCPSPKETLTRGSEAALLIVKTNSGHTCNDSVVVIAIVIWEGIDKDRADSMYESLRSTVARNEKVTARGVATARAKDCRCQGDSTGGASFSYGCSWSSYTGGLCKFAASHGEVNKFCLGGNSSKEDEKEFEDTIQELAQVVASALKLAAPAAYSNQVASEDTAMACRLGRECGRPFSSATIVADYAAHPHTDSTNMAGGCTSVVTLLRSDVRRSQEVPQTHVLTLYQQKVSKDVETGRDFGVGLALLHGSLLFEVAKSEVHCTTPVKDPCRSQPHRLGVVLYLHRGLNERDHGREELNARKKRK